MCWSNGVTYNSKQTNVRCIGSGCWSFVCAKIAIHKGETRTNKKKKKKSNSWLVKWVFFHFVRACMHACVRVCVCLRVSSNESQMWTVRYVRNAKCIYGFVLFERVHKTNVIWLLLSSGAVNFIARIFVRLVLCTVFAVWKVKKVLRRTSSINKLHFKCKFELLNQNHCELSRMAIMSTDIKNVLQNSMEDDDDPPTIAKRPHIYDGEYFEIVSRDKDALIIR